METFIHVGEDGLNIAFVSFRIEIPDSVEVQRCGRPSAGWRAEPPQEASMRYGSERRPRNLLERSSNNHVGCFMPAQVLDGTAGARLTGITTELLWNIALGGDLARLPHARACRQHQAGGRACQDRCAAWLEGFPPRLRRRLCSACTGPLLGQAPAPRGLPRASYMGPLRHRGQSGVRAFRDHARGMATRRT